MDITPTKKSGDDERMEITPVKTRKTRHKSTALPKFDRSRGRSDETKVDAIKRQLHPKQGLRKKSVGETRGTTRAC